jgi:hypothetical protein
VTGLLWRVTGLLLRVTGLLWRVTGLLLRVTGLLWRVTGLLWRVTGLLLRAGPCRHRQVITFYAAQVRAIAALLAAAGVAVPVHSVDSFQAPSRVLST